ncbi:GlsB/YeaQ/YmgE family stress response membrane protein [Nocardia fluminea]|uniref:Putative membrane protein YeaQ/YmgE (Transglycosylase-associated protein family) n=1 Tax=Nocardia fluminea TaxID=134984 RepID=A0A2N3VHU0_9NOCA|nr:GlsB/YeaQ/YmgE family stress response membrane protein [Nocardia fluminea]PKV81191.1 putative membrane protein YeaQ/YmgE (transglycosylase-associated protein family) [Nocardia fluminea]
MWNAIVQICGFLIIGAVIGVLARMLKPGKENMSMGMTLVLGMAAALIAGVIASLIGVGSITELNFWGFVLAVVAAVVLLFAAESMGARKHPPVA